MNAAGWALLFGAAASAGVYCGGLTALARGRWKGGNIPLPGLLAATALFAFARVFQSSAPLAVLAALFCAVAVVQISVFKRADILLKALTIVPPAAMGIVSVTQVFATTLSSVFQAALAATLCAPIVLTFALSLRNLHLVRKTAFDRVR